METEELKEKTQDLGNHVGDYLNTLYRLTMVTITQKVTNIASGVIVALSVCIFGLFIIFFASLGAAWWLGDVVNSRTGGFLIVDGFYFLLMLCIILLRRKIVFPSIRNRIIGKVYE